MKIAIDLQGAQTISRYRGIGRYSVSLAAAIARNCGRHQISLALNGAFPESAFTLRREFQSLIPPEQIRIFQPPLPAAGNHTGNKWRTRAGELIREYTLASLQPDVLVISSLFEGFADDAVTSLDIFVPGANTAVILYDLIPALKPAEYLGGTDYREHYFQKMEHLKKAGLLLAISEATRREALSFPGLRDLPVRNISAAVDDRFRPVFLAEDEARELRTSYGIRGRFVLYAPGGFDSRKNFRRLIQAWAGLPQRHRDRYQLVIVGEMTDEYARRMNRLRSEGGLTERDLIFPGYLPDEDFVRLMNIAELLVCPSLLEGFGLPVLEAMACGIPVAASRIPSVVEVIGREDCLFDPRSAASIGRALIEILDHETLRNELKEYGLRRARDFSWDKCALAALEALEALHSGTGGRPCPPPDKQTLFRGILAVSEGSEVDERLRRCSRAIAASTCPANRPRRIFVDVSSLSACPSPTGIQRVAGAQLIELLKAPPPGYETIPVRLVRREGGWRYRAATPLPLSLLGLEKLRLPFEPVDMSPGDILYIPDYNHGIIEAAGELHRLKALGIRIHGFVHDLLPLSHPEFFMDGFSELHARWLATMAGISDRITCNSAVVAAELTQWLRNNPSRLHPVPAINCIHLGADIEASLLTGGSPLNLQRLPNFPAPSPSFLMVGSIEPRKGHLQTVRAFKLLRDEGLDLSLVIFGRESWSQLPAGRSRTMPDAVRVIRENPESGQRLFWIEDGSDERLLQAYRESTCLLFASEAEGFGLPLVEAARQGLPVIARDIPVFREIAGEGAFYFQGQKPEDIADAVREWLVLYRAGQHPKPEAVKWITWRENVEQLKKILIIDD